VNIVHPEKTRAADEKDVYDSSGLVCFFCNVKIMSGDEIILRNDKKFYHRKCYEYLFTLKSSSISFQ
jgi:hypothetical protein